MRIISKFKDYYDHVAGHDPDPRKTYLREKVSVGWDELRGMDEGYKHEIYIRRTRKWNRRREESSIYSLKTLFFCDRSIPIVHEKKAGEYIFHYSMDTLPDDFDDFYESAMHGDAFRNKRFVDILGSSKPTKINRHFDTPVFYEDTKNIRLTDISFNKYMSPSQCFTEIYNWLPFVEPDLPMGGPDDMIRYQQHGFDKKTSFRKM